MRLASQGHSHDWKGLSVRTPKLVGLAAVGLMALAACTNVQGAALYVGDERISEETLDAFVDDQVSSFISQGATEADIDFGQNREAAVLCVLFAELGRNMDLEAPDTSEAVTELDEECLHAQGALAAVAEEAEPRELTDSEQSVLADAGYEYETVPPEGRASLDAGAGLYTSLTEYIDRYDVRVNPRYGVDTFSVMTDELSELFEVEIPQR